MRRRELITILGGAAAMWPLAMRAQQPKKPRIGFLVTGSLELPRRAQPSKPSIKDYANSDMSMVRTSLVEVRAADLKIERFPALASELVRLNVDLIVASNSPAARAAQQATTTIPIVVPVMGDPVGDGLVASLARPGGNITGLTFLGPQLVPKRLALLKEALPSASRVAALWHPGAYGERTMNDMMKEAEEAALTLGVQLRLVAVQGPDDLDRAFSTIAGERADAIHGISEPDALQSNEDALSTSPESIGCL